MNRETMNPTQFKVRAKRGKGRGSTLALPPAPRAPRGNAFAKVQSMPTAKSIMDATRQLNRKAEEEEHLGPPPSSADLIQARLVLPGKGLLPRGFDEPGALDNVRRTHKVYITNIQPNILDIRCDSIFRLQRAIKAINWVIHDLRLATDHPPMRIVLQEPSAAMAGEMIRTERCKRPRYFSMTSVAINNPSAMDHHMARMTADVENSAETLMTLDKHLRMRVGFGQFILRQRFKDAQDETSKDVFAGWLQRYSSRGGAGFEPRLPNVEEAEALVRYLTDPSMGVCVDAHGVRSSSDLTLTIQGMEVVAEILHTADQPQLASPRAQQPEEWARINWTVAAPEMKFDWNFRVDAWDKVEKLPDGLKNLAQMITLLPPQIEADSPNKLNGPRIGLLRLGGMESQVSQIRLKTGVIIPWKDTPFAIEVNVTETWNDGRRSTAPELSWSIELYELSWDESMNYLGAGERRKDWGEGFCNIWPGGDLSFEARFANFIRTVLEVQAVFEGINFEPTSLLD